MLLSCSSVLQTTKFKHLKLLETVSQGFIAKYMLIEMLQLLLMAPMLVLYLNVVIF